jgi:hypothetical protein
MSLGFNISSEYISADTTGLEIQVHIEINVVISFRLEVFASVFGLIAIVL